MTMQAFDFKGLKSISALPFKRTALRTDNDDLKHNKPYGKLWIFNGHNHKPTKFRDKHH